MSDAAISPDVAAELAGLTHRLIPELKRIERMRKDHVLPATVDAALICLQDAQLVAVCAIVRAREAQRR